MTTHVRAPSGTGRATLCGNILNHLDHIALAGERVSCPECLKILEVKNIAGKPMTTEEDLVNQPSHYTQGGIEVIDYIEAKLTAEAFRGYLEGNVIKYLSRWRDKGGVQDLKKAQWYLNRLVKREDM